MQKIKLTLKLFKIKLFKKLKIGAKHHENYKNKKC